MKTSAIEAQEWLDCFTEVTRDFAAGKRVKSFSGIERSARLKLDRVEAAVALNDLAVLPGNGHPHQRSVAELLRVAREVPRAPERGDC